jgi:hypothetical protein
MEENQYVGKNIKVEAPEPPQTDIDVNKSLEDAILTAAQTGNLKTDIFESFSSSAQTRETEYELIDTMAQDSTIAAALETYAEDITQANQNGDIFWAEANDSDIATYVNYLLKKINVDKQAYPWALMLVKYGDVYVRLLRNSDFENSRLFNSKKQTNRTLHEDVNLNISKENDHYALSVEAVANPNEMFELTKFGKSMGYIKAATNVQKNYGSNNNSYFTTYNIRNKDVDIYPPTDFVHACLESSTTRTEEELDIFFNDDDYSNQTNAETFKVRRGAGILNDLFKVWRQLTLEENAVLLNRVTRSSVVRAIQMEVGDMPVNQVTNVTSKVKNLIEQKASLDVGKNMSEFTNPGPIENTIIIPTRNGKGALTINQIGGEVDPKQLTDLDWFNNKLFGGLKIPKQYFGWTDDAGGFNAGTSLSQYSSRYGKAVKRMQQCLIEMVTDMINLILIDAGYPRYINQFHIKMQSPITQEEIDRKADLSNTLRNVSDVMNTLADVQTPSAKLKVLKLLLSQCLNEQEISNILQQEIEKLENEEEKGEVPGGADDNAGEDMGLASPLANSGGSDFSPLDRELPEESGNDETLEEIPTEETPAETTTEPTPETSTGSTPTEDNSLPSFADLGVDGTVNL